MPDKSSKSTRKTGTGTSSGRAPQKRGGRSNVRKSSRTSRDTASEQTPQYGQPRKGTRRPRSLKSTRPHKRVYHLVVNLLSGNQPEFSLKLAKKLERRITRSNRECIVHSVSSWQEFNQEVIKALRERPYALVIFGGDGSVRMAASRVARAKGLLGIIPCGRYNNIFHSLYGNTDAEEALNLVQSEYQMRIDAGLANGNFFLGSLVSGLLPIMIDRLGSKRLPRLAMTWSKMAAHAADETMPRTTHMKVDAYTFKVQPLLLNIHLLTYLMSLRFAPVASPDDGRMVVIYDSEGTRDPVIHYIRDLKKDRYQYTGSLHMLRGQKVSIIPSAGRTWLIDGDEIRFSGEEIGIEVLHRVLRVFADAPAND